MTTVKRKQKVFNEQKDKQVFQKGIKLLAISLPLLFISPIVVTIGFKALRRDQQYGLLVLGCLMVVLTIVLVAQAFRHLLKSFFGK